MPIYEYRCDKCGHQFEVLIRNQADYPSACPACRKGKPVKAFSSFAALSGSATKAAPCAGGACPLPGGGCSSMGCGGGCPIA